MKTFFLKEYNVWCAAVGFHLNKVDFNTVLNYLHNVKIENALDIIQLINSRRVFNFLHIIIAVYKTYRAFLQKRNIAKEKSMEFILRLSGKRNIRDALQIVGINENVKEAIFICCDTNIEKINNAVENFKNTFKISENDNLLEFYENKSNELRLAYNLVTNNMFYEILTRISFIETYS
ncbi:MAG: KEOPS complex subunit Cgi121 [Thermoproteota archaeon]|nr:KEOPS complex subunit Cgi121 [Thermoproteota archaeon]